MTQIPPFCPTGVQLADVHKTGLGSSAALITSLVTALLVHLKAVSREDISNLQSEGRRLAHNQAQFVHCFAQGKVGSGFDVASAVFGSHIYTRFDPSVIQPLMTEDSVSMSVSSPCVYYSYVITQSIPLLPVISPSNKAWDYKFEPIQLPPHTRMMLADVDAGSDTPSMAGKVLKWRKEQASDGTNIPIPITHEDHSNRRIFLASEVWNSLDRLNMQLASTFRKLGELHASASAAYMSAVKKLISLKPSEVICKSLFDLSRDTQYLGAVVDRGIR